MSQPSTRKLKEELKNRGYTVTHSSDLVSGGGRNKQGDREKFHVKREYIRTDPFIRQLIYQKCASIFGIVTSRANRISALDISIIPLKKKEDRIAQYLKDEHERWNELDEPTLENLGRRLVILGNIREHLNADVASDLSNFDKALRRWSRRIQNYKTDYTNKIMDTLMEPSPGTTWPDLMKQKVQDLLVHGAASTYKITNKSNKIRGLRPFPGGTLVPVRSKYLNQHDEAYVQIYDGMYRFNLEEIQVFRREEVSFIPYMPNSSVGAGMIPIDALLNEISESMLFSATMADYADGSRAADWLILMGNSMGPMSPDEDMSMPVGDGPDEGEIKRLETKLNEKKKDQSVSVYRRSAENIEAIRLDRAEMIADQINRQDQVDKKVALVFNATMGEINETGSSGTSGKSTSESQERIENARGVRPILRAFEAEYSRVIIPGWFGPGYDLNFISQRSDEERISLVERKVKSNAYDVNSIRIAEGLDPYPEAEYDRPAGQTPGGELVDGLSSLMGG